MRLDKYLTAKYPDRTRSQIILDIKNGAVTVNGSIVKAGYEVKDKDKIECDPLRSSRPPVALAENIELNIVYEDNELMVINKPRGMVVHPGAGVKSGTVLNALLGRSGTTLERAGIVHRLDKNTAGLLLVAKTARAQAALSAMFQKHTIKRTYIGIVEGRISADMTINKNIIRHPNRRTIFTTMEHGGRTAITHLRVLERFDKFTVCEFTLETGRTHQIRVHCKSIGHPIVGDPEYNPNGGIKTEKGQMLEAVGLSFLHFLSGERINITIAPTKEWTEIKQKCYHKK